MMNYSVSQVVNCAIEKYSENSILRRFLGYGVCQWSYFPHKHLTPIFLKLNFLLLQEFAIWSTLTIYVSAKLVSNHD